MDFSNFKNSFDTLFRLFGSNFTGKQYRQCLHIKYWTKFDFSNFKNTFDTLFPLFGSNHPGKLYLHVFLVNIHGVKRVMRMLMLSTREKLQFIPLSKSFVIKLLFSVICSEWTKSHSRHFYFTQKHNFNYKKIIMNSY